MFNFNVRSVHPIRSAARLALPLFTIALTMAVIPATAQPKPAPNGDYVGTLGPLLLKLHLKADPGGTMSGTLDSPDQGANGLACADFHIDGQSLSFTVPAVHGSWKGTASSDGLTLSGTWDQGKPMPLSFARDTFVAATKPSRIDGIWLGTLQAGSASLRIQIHVKSDTSGHEFCTLDSLDQHAMGLDCANVAFAADNFSVDVPAVKGNWVGKLSADGNSLAGTWSQGGNSLPLNLTRQAAAVAAKEQKIDSAIAPVTAAELQMVLDRDLAEAFKSGELAPTTGAGLSIAVVNHGVRRVFSYGTAKPDSIFEIGSITKTFTGLILSQMVEEGKVKFDDPVRTLLPPETVAKPAGSEITLLDLATQHSGLPRMPDNFAPVNPANPYVDYRAGNLYAFLAKQGVAKPAQTEFVYSNLGFGLLGQALAVRAGTTYPELLKAQIVDPLGLRDTTVALSPAQKARFIMGHNGNHQPTSPWDLDAFAGAGAIRSTAADMLTYLEANLHPENLKPAASSPAASTLSAALTQSHQLRAEAMGGMRIALAWLYEPDSDTYWHNGATGGFSSYAFFSPKGDYAAVVLLNTTLGANGSFADRLGQHIRQRLAGQPAISLAD